MTVEVCGRVSVPSRSPGGSSHGDGGGPFDDGHSEGRVSSSASPLARETTEPTVNRPKFMITDILAQRGPSQPTQEEDQVEGGAAAISSAGDHLKNLSAQDDDSTQHNDDNDNSE